MNNYKHYDLIIIGGGSAGLASAIGAHEQGIRSILILERDQELGGILQQCIHNGFGLHTFKEELSGPAYAERYIEQLKSLGIEYKLNSMVTHLQENKEVEYVNPTDGYVRVSGKAIILAMGCRERTRGAIAIPGYRPSGVWSAGTAQRYLNMEGYLVGKRVFILGSGDIGLIMARRMTLEGAKVLGVAEIMPYSNGLPRNMKQCLDDFDIPLYLSHTITTIEGKDRVTGIKISQVDSNMNILPDTEKHFDVDTVLLSVGLIPENGLSEEANIQLHPKTRGPIVDESYQTNVSGIFACGNVLHVHDLVDFVSGEGKKAGIAASKYIHDTLSTSAYFDCITGNSIGYVIPQKVNVDNIDKSLELMFRVTKAHKDVQLIVKKDGVAFKQFTRRHMAPAEMEKIVLKKEDLLDCKSSLSIEVSEENV